MKVETELITYNSSTTRELVCSEIYTEEVKICVLSTFVAYATLSIGLFAWGMIGNLPVTTILCGALGIPLIPAAGVFLALVSVAKKAQPLPRTLREYQRSF